MAKPKGEAKKMATEKRTNEAWRTLVAKQRLSGKTQREWCEANGINLHTFVDRASRLRKMDREASAQAGRTKKEAAVWMDVTPERVLAPGSGIKIERGGYAVTVNSGFNAELLAEVLRTVGRACC